MIVFCIESHQIKVRTNGISFDQAKFERLFSLVLEACKKYQLVNRLQEIEDYVIAKW